MGIITRTHLLKPASEAPGTFENVNNVQTDFTDISTVVNGSLDTANLASNAKPANTLGWWRPVHHASGTFENKTGVLHYLTTGAANGAAIPNGTASNSSAYVFPFDPADYAVTGLTAQCRVRLTYVMNTVGPNMGLTAGVYSITASGGGANQVSITLAGSSVVIAGAPGGTAKVSSAETNVGTTSVLPAAGVYCFGATIGTTQQAGQRLIISVRFDVRHVI